MSEAALHEPWRDLRRQHQAYTLGIWIFIAGETLFFGALFFFYITARLEHPAAIAEAAQRTNLPFGAINTAILLASSAAVAAAERLADEHFERAARGALVLALALGAAFIAVKALEYREDMAEHLLPGAGFALSTRAAALFWGFYWTATGVHAAHVTIGLALFIRILALSAPPQPIARSSLSVTALYWHFVDIVWVCLYPMLYLVGR
jgi:cytochrome c oxidase subunit 3